MRPCPLVRLGVLLPFVVAAASSARLAAQPGAAAQPGWSDVEAALGRPGAAQPGGVVRFGFPRADMHVSVGGVQVRPALALGSWIAFRRVPGGAMAMGDLVLADSEVAPVIASLQQAGVRQTALHNHLLGESPRVTYLHVSARGDAVALVRAVRAALALTGTPMQAPSPAVAPQPFGLDTAALARALGRTGKVNGGVWQVSVPRAQVVRENGMEVPPAMGVASAINVQPTGAGRAAATGDLVLTAGEVDPVVRELRAGGIAVTALHSHMLAETPRLLFMHFWGEGDALRLATTLRAALSRMAVR